MVLDSQGRRVFTTQTAPREWHYLKTRAESELWSIPVV